MNYLIIPILMSLLSFQYSGNINMGKNASTATDEKPLFSFGIIADVQYCDCDPAGTRFYRSSLSKLTEAAKTLSREKADFVINLGDIIEKNFSSYDKVLAILNEYQLKTYHITGNHDYSVEHDLKKSIPVLGLNREGYYSFVRKKLRFIFLNGNEISTYSAINEQAIAAAKEYLARLHGSGSINVMDWNGGISRNQLDWLEEQINAGKKQNEKILIFCHFPVAPENIHNLLNYKEVLPILNKYDNIIAWISGHNHAGNYAFTDNTHFITMKGMVETEKTNSFSLLRVYKNRIEIKGYGNENDRILKY